VGMCRRQEIKTCRHSLSVNQTADGTASAAMLTHDTSSMVHSFGDAVAERHRVIAGVARQQPRPVI